MTPGRKRAAYAGISGRWYGRGEEHIQPYSIRVRPKRGGKIPLFVKHKFTPDSTQSGYNAWPKRTG